MVFNAREVGNGIKKGRVVEIAAPPRSSTAVQDSTRHIVRVPKHIITLKILKLNSILENFTD